jgi:hypothetical protein
MLRVRETGMTYGFLRLDITLSSGAPPNRDEDPATKTWQEPAGHKSDEGAIIPDLRVEPIFSEKDLGLQLDYGLTSIPEFNRCWCRRNEARP